jgi:type II secretory ATPase GspE/PulE/Tfp pilus assembly ATPase PilB-like protein
MSPPNEEYVLDLLRDAGLVTSPQIEEARANLDGSTRIVELLVRQGIVADDDVSRSLAAQTQMQWIDLGNMVVPQEVIDEIKPEDARRFKMIPIARNENSLVVATGDPLDFDSIDGLSFLLKREIDLVCTTPEKIRQALVKYYGSAEEAVDILREKIGDTAAEELDIAEGADLPQGEGGEAPIVRMVSMLLLDAHKLGASDIHLEPLEKSFRVRFRIDGVLQEMQSPPKKLQSAIISRLKIMTGSMSIAEKRLPQDGRIQVKMGKKSIDLRVSALPTNHGESMVMRLLDKSNLLLGLPELGFLSDDQEIFERLLRAPDGILLVTGPTGSGKTSTLYACLNYINKPDRKIITIEEPVEYQMNGINQVQVNAEIGMTFPVALRSILRQAPNIIMIGEIRDRETAAIATNAGLTGHLVFSTLHTNDAPSAIARLIDIGVQPLSRRDLDPRDHGAATRQATMREVQGTGPPCEIRPARAAPRSLATGRGERDAPGWLRTLPADRL